MRKIILLLVFLLLFSGCSMQVKKVSYTSYIDTVYQVLEERMNLHNVSLEGYYYYLPAGSMLVEKKDTNSIIRYQDLTFYLYVDIVSYYHRAKSSFTLDRTSYYESKIQFDDNEGYLKIRKVGKVYLVEYMYHYAKIESFVSEEKLNEAIYQMSVILSNVRYNDKILESLVGDNSLNYHDEFFDILAPKNPDSAGNVLDYDQTYEGYEGEVKDEDSIEIKVEER